MSNTWERAYPEEGIAWSNDNAPYLNEANLGIMDEALKTHDKRLLDLYGYRTTMMDLVNKAEEYGEEAKEYVDAQTKENEAYVDEKVARAEAAIENAQDAIDNANATAENAKKSVDGWLASADVKMNRMQEQTDTATNNANAAANNANEAAKAIFNEKYILTARTEFNRSTSVSPTAKGNAILEKLKGDSWQRTLSGKNKFDCSGLTVTTSNGITFTPTYKDGLLEYILVNGTATEQARYYFTSNLIFDSDTIISLEGASNGGVSGYAFGTNIFAEEKKVNANTSYGTFFLFVNSGVTINNTKIYPMIRLASVADATYEPYCGNTQSPNPSYEQKIRSVGDMGWFDGEWLQGYYSSSDGLHNNSISYVCCKNVIPCKSGDVIKVITEKSLTVGTRYFNDNTFISSDTVANTSVAEFVVPSGVNKFVFNVALPNQGAITKNTVGNVCVTINGKYALIVDECNKNKFNHNNSIVGFITSGLVQNAANMYRISEIYPIGQYVVSWGENTADYLYIIYYNESKEIIRRKIITTNNKTSTKVEQNVGEFYFAVMYAWGGENGNSFTYDIQIEAGDTVSPHVPHQSKRTYIPLDEPLRGIEDIKDEVYCVDGLYEEYRRFEEYVFNSAKSFVINGGHAENIARWYAPFPDNFTLGHARVLLCDKLTVSDNAGNQNTKYSYVCKSNANGLNFLMDLPIEIARTTDDLDIWLQANPIKITYERAKPTFIPFEDQTPFYELMAYDEVTHVSIAGCHEELNPTATMRFPRNEDGAMVTTNWCDNKKNEIRMNELTAALLALNQK